MSNPVFAYCGIGFDFDFFFGQDLPDLPDSNPEKQILKILLILSKFIFKLPILQPRRAAEPPSFLAS
jgi:hypothetical protein